MRNKRKYNTQLITGAVIGYILGYIFCHSFLNSLAFAITGFYLTMLIFDLGVTIPIESFMLSLASIQWLLGPALAYSGYSNHPKYYMYVSQETYYPFAMGGIIVFHLGIAFMTKRKVNFNFEACEKIIREQLEFSPSLPYYLIGLGLFASVLARFIPASLAFLMNLLGNVSFIGVIYLLYSKTKLKWWGLLGMTGLLFMGSLANGMFHDLLLWLSFIAFYLAKIHQFSLRSKLLFVAAGIGFALLIQLVKAEFRTYVWSGYGGNKVSLFINLASDELSEDDTPEDYNSKVESIVVRLNQGWIISRIMYHIPDEEDYLHGESVKKAIYGSIVPRFADPNKEKAGGQDYFERFTGYNLKNTSMGASLLGEGYANFGEMGGLLFLFIYALFIGWALNLIFKIAQNYPTIILWLPLLFLQVVKAESDLLRVLNQLTKAALVVYLLYWFLGKQLKWKI
jgi:hypothetical protein